MTTGRQFCVTPDYRYVGSRCENETCAAANAPATQDGLKLHLLPTPGRRFGVLYQVNGTHTRGPHAVFLINLQLPRFAA